MRGRVFSGRGEGSFYVSIYARQFERVIGYRPYPGTLNVKLDGGEGDRLASCLSKARALRVDPPLIEGARLGGVLVYRASLLVGLDLWPVYIVRPMITHYKSDVVELISETYLRGELGLKDGDEVEIDVECC